ncbi:helix-turn-helix domain protein [mine drainage metagenome]|jgi:excisionase family DNA binding protein|uniref:Helix-turn-helix domain protein n=1 Tax=mine drainage metagenome TaxID=410659 RepID=A0A1J5R7K2_9ZZZZ
MHDAIHRAREAAAPAVSPLDREMARVAQRCLMEALDHSRAASITLTTESGEHPSIALPPASLKIIGQVLGMMSAGRPIVLMPAKQEMSTVEAANFLNVSRPFVIKEIREGRLAHRMVGTHRRIAFSDLVEYAQGMQTQRLDALDRMAANAAELGLEY